jgi:hypothetical protein
MVDLGYPPACKIDRVVFKKMFHDAGDLSRADKTLLTDSVDKITWAYNLKRENTMIPPYQDEVRKYEEVQVMHVLLKQPKGIRRLAEIIMRAIPYPMLLIFEHHDRLAVALAHQRGSLADSAKNTLEELWISDFLPPQAPLFTNLRHDGQRFTNFFDYYTDLVDALCWAMAQSAGAPVEVTGEQARDILHGIASLDARIATLRAELKKETRFNRKMELNIEMKQLEGKKQQLLTATGGYV